MIVTNLPKSTLPINHTQYLYLLRNPVIQGASVIALHFKGGVILACDTQLTYGSGMAKFFNYDRFEKIND